MSREDLEKYIVRDVWHKSYPDEFHKEDTQPALVLGRKDGGAGYPPFSLSWVPISQAFEMAPKPHVHDWDEILMFIGSDGANMLELGGEVELSLGEDENHLE